MPDADLTTRARAVLAGLTDAMCNALRRSVDPQLAYPGRELVGASPNTARALHRRALVDRDMERWGISHPAWCLTDLGREVARLLAEGWCDVNDSDLTTRARAVLAERAGELWNGIDLRRAIANRDGGGTLTMAQYERLVIGGLASHGKCDGLGVHVTGRTDLGREVARLLAEGGA